MPECVICGCTDFYAEAGFYFCKECQTQNEDVREEVLELRVDLTTRVRKIRIRKDKSCISEQNLGWTTWEQYNFILIGLTNELIELGVSQNIKMTILQLWAFYLSKLEVAFTSTTKKSVPKLARKFHKRDAEIIYGKIAQRKKNRRRSVGSNASASSVVSAALSERSSNRDKNKQKKLMVAAEYERLMQSQESSEGDALSVMNQSLFSVQSSAGKSSARTDEDVQFNKAAKKESKKVKILSMKLPRLHRSRYRENHATTQYKIGPQVLTPMKLWSLIYLALRIHDEDIQLADMLRYGREGHLSYYRLDHLLPVEVTLSKKETNMLHQTKEITHNGMRQSIGTMAKFLQVWQIQKPDIFSLIDRYCTELQLPKGIAIYAERMLAMSSPKMSFGAKTVSFPNYEGRAMALIIVVVKMLFGLDGITEHEISRVAEMVNRNEAESFASIKRKIIEPCIIVSGGTIADDSLNPVFVEMVEACRISASLGYRKILRGGNSVDAVESALWWLENDEFFNCGYGSVLNNEGYVEMDAGMMNGTTLECGSVVAIRDSEHPISLARYVMENFPNTIIAGNGGKELAKIAGMKSILPENIISPASYVANEKKYPPRLGYFDGLDEEATEILKTSNLGAVGCIAWDGNSIVAGTSSGGMREKMVGRVGDSALVGCGIFANDNCACCLTGQGESIMKIGLARNVVENITIEGTPPREALQMHLDDTFDSLDHQAAGIVLRTDGTTGVYWNNENSCPMPYAVIKKHWITSPTADGEKRMEKYEVLDNEEMCKCDYEFLSASKKGVLESRLFSFCEWQRYIECRRTMLTDVHFPTKLKRDPGGIGDAHWYLKFFAAMRAKSNDREEPVVTSYKHLIPRELADAMKKIIVKLEETENSAQRNVEIFSPSLTPQYSYCQQLLQDPEKELPSILRTQFSTAKIGYMTKPEALQSLAARCNIDLEIKDSGVHFLEKIVPTFALPDLPNIQEFNELVVVDKPVAVANCIGSLPSGSCEDADEYLHRKGPGSIHVDLSKRRVYDDVCKTRKEQASDITMDSTDDFGFDDVLPNGKLLLRSRDDNGDENSIVNEENDEYQRHDDKNSQFTIDSLARYNIGMSNFEKGSLAHTLNAGSTRIESKKAKRKVVRDPVSGKFVSAKNGIDFSVMNETNFAKIRVRVKEESRENNESESCDESRLTQESNKNGQDSWYDFCLNDDDISVLQDTSFESLNDAPGEIEFSDTRKEFLTLLRPHSDYWMLRCNFSRVKQKSFRQLERYLPANFRWLLEECSNVVEMSEEELYKEVCLVEMYYADLLKLRKTGPITSRRYDNNVYPSKADCNDAKKKW